MPGRQDAPATRGIPRTSSVKSRKPAGSWSGSSEKPWTFRPFTRRKGGGDIAPEPSEHQVLRAAVLSIVLTLAVGPNAALLCAVWCHPGAARTSECQHQDATTSPRVSGEDSCRTAQASATAVVREDARRGSAAAVVQHAVAAPRFQVAPPLADATRANPPRMSPAAYAPPVLIALRI